MICDDEINVDVNENVEDFKSSMKSMCVGLNRVLSDSLMKMQLQIHYNNTDVKRPKNWGGGWGRVFHPNVCLLTSPLRFWFWYHQNSSLCTGGIVTWLIADRYPACGLWEQWTKGQNDRGEESSLNTRRKIQPLLNFTCRQKLIKHSNPRIG